jgi:hypothetical protein
MFWLIVGWVHALIYDWEIWLSLPLVWLVMSNILPKISMIFGSGPSHDDWNR